MLCKTRTICRRSLLNSLRSSSHTPAQPHYNDHPAAKTPDYRDSHADVPQVNGVVSFREFVAFHGKFRARPSTPISRMIYFSETEYDYEHELGEHFLEMLEFYIQTERLRSAADLVRNVVCSGLLQSDEHVTRLKHSLMEALTNELSNQIKGIEVIDYLDIALWFNDDPIYKNLALTVIRRNWENQTVLEDINKSLANRPNYGHLLSAFHTAIIKESLDSEQLDLATSDVVDYSHITRDTAIRFMRTLAGIQEYELASDFVQLNSVRNPGIVFAFYKKLVRNASSDALSDGAVMERYELWMRQNGFKVLKESDDEV